MLYYKCYMRIMITSFVLIAVVSLVHPVLSEELDSLHC